MKVTIKAGGVMVIQSVSEFEAYALRMWGEVNEGLIPDSIIIKSDFPVDNPYPALPDHKVTKSAPDQQRKRNFIMSALGEHSAGVTSPEEFVNLLMETL